MPAITAKPITATPITARPLTAYRLGESTDGANPLVWQALYYDSDGVLQSQITGAGTPTWSHTSTLLLPDWEGIYRTIPAGTAPITGARQVRNLACDYIATKVQKLNSSDDLTGQPSGTNVTENFTGTSTIFTCTSDASYVRFCKSAGALSMFSVAGQEIVVSFEARGIGDSVGKNIEINTTATGDIPAAPIVTLSEDFQRFSTLRTKANSNVENIYVSLGLGNGTVSNGEQVEIKKVQIELVNGQANQNPGDYVYAEKTAATGDYTGTSKYFSYENGNTVTSNVVTEAQGDPLTDWWFQCQSAKTNKALYSNDASNAAWVKTDMTGAKNAVGLDGAPNTGSTLTATGANATAIQTVTSASADHVARFFLRRKTGTGTVNICCDGSTWSEAVLTADYQEFMVLANTTNPQIGVQIVTSGDAVEMENGECYTATIPVIRGSSPIITAASTVSTTAVKATFDGDNWDDTNGGLYLEVNSQVAQNILSTFLSINGSNFQLSDGTNTATKAWTADTDHKVGIIWNAAAGTMKLNVDNSWSAATTYDGTLLVGDLDLGRSASGVLKVRDIRRWNSYSAAEAAIDALMAA